MSKHGVGGIMLWIFFSSPGTEKQVGVYGNKLVKVGV